jgi:hypothetical protein
MRPNFDIKARLNVGSYFDGSDFNGSVTCLSYTAYSLWLQMNSMKSSFGTR